MTRYLTALVLAVSLTGCGFHLRNRLTLPEDTPAVKVESNVRYSELVKLLERGLHASGAVVVGEDAPGKGAARLQIRSERWGDLPIARNTACATRWCSCSSTPTAACWCPSR